VLDDRRREAMSAVRKLIHAGILPRLAIPSNPVSVTMPGGRVDALCQSGAVATVVLDPGGVRVASELIEAALPKLRSRVRSRTNTRARETCKAPPPV
jgi:hypothetical protein